jgi:hypothetical protein
MKLAEIHKNLLEIAKELGITIRKENGNFKSGFCYLNDNKIIVFNKSAPVELMNTVLVKCLLQNEIENHYIAPVMRDFIDKEKEKLNNSEDFEFEVEY